MQVAPEVQRALNAQTPVVALESTIIAHGLPRPDNLRVAREIEQVVRDNGATPATIAILGGEVHVGLDDAALERLANSPGGAQSRVRGTAGGAAPPAGCAPPPRATPPGAACGPRGGPPPARWTARRPSPPPRTSPSARASA